MRRGHLPEPTSRCTSSSCRQASGSPTPTMQQSYASLSYSHVAAHLERSGVNVVAQLVAPQPDGASDPRQPVVEPRYRARSRGLCRRAAQGRPADRGGRSRSTPTCPTCPARPRCRAADLDIVLDPRAAAFRAVRAAEGAGVARRLRDGAARRDPDQGRRHAADRHRLVRRRADARADPAPYAERAVPRVAGHGSASRRPAAPSSVPSSRGSTAAARCWSTASSRCAAPAS